MLNFPESGGENFLEFRGGVIAVPDDVHKAFSVLGGSVDSVDFISIHCQLAVSDDEVLMTLDLHHGVTSFVIEETWCVLKNVCCLF